MATIKLNGVTLEPQPADASWDDNLIDQKLNATDATGAFRLFTIRAPALAGQDFNWQQFENQVLTSLQAYAPGDRPTGTDVTYASGVVSRKIQSYRMGDDRTVTGVQLEIWVAVV